MRITEQEKWTRLPGVVTGFRGIKTTTAIGFQTGEAA